MEECVTFASSQMTGNTKVNLQKGFNYLNVKCCMQLSCVAVRKFKQPLLDCCKVVVVANMGEKPSNVGHIHTYTTRHCTSD